MSVLRLLPQLPAQTLHGGGFQRMVRKGGDAGVGGGEGAKERREGEMAQLQRICLLLSCMCVFSWNF